MMKRLLPKPTNLRSYSCHVIINNQRFTKLEISPYYEKHNTEYLEALKSRKIKLSAKELAKKLITDDLIRELVKQLQSRRHFSESRYYQWTYYSFQTYWGVKAYKLVWCVADNESKVLGVVDCYRQEKFDRN